ncbi:hypothetical protein BK816_08785 [Boudabousia tangfeifanii]|uniref:Uncharacterized protein n=1 Tax=Boudabousia tangfeifanii TaxID=1912795 RepID=A0A1D9MMG5_9ACTO|nr:hypothetical protein [Boudabousia tangfeifanii]AOZ73353.1 hypothetical protein BK816_08785 [Boudabousia tangfeifanii]
MAQGKRHPFRTLLIALLLLVGGGYLITHGAQVLNYGVNFFEHGLVTINQWLHGETDNSQASTPEETNAAKPSVESPEVPVEPKEKELRIAVGSDPRGPFQPSKKWGNDPTQNLYREGKTYVTKLVGQVSAETSQDLKNTIVQARKPLELIMETKEECPPLPKVNPNDLKNFMTAWNQVRKQVGVAPLKLMPDNHPAWADLQQGAWSMVKANTFSHGLLPAKDYPCRTTGGAKATAKADISLERFGGWNTSKSEIQKIIKKYAISPVNHLLFYFHDTGDNNEAVGHRISMMNPVLKETAVGILGEKYLYYEKANDEHKYDAWVYGQKMATAALGFSEESPIKGLKPEEKVKYRQTIWDPERFAKAPQNYPWPSAGYVPAMFLTGQENQRDAQGQQGVWGDERYSDQLKEPGRWSFTTLVGEKDLFKNAQIKVYWQDRFNSQREELKLQGPINPNASQAFWYPTVTFKPWPADDNRLREMPNDQVRTFWVEIKTANGQHRWVYPVKVFRQLETFKPAKAQWVKSSLENGKAKLAFTIEGTAGTEFTFTVWNEKAKKWQPLAGGKWDGITWEVAEALNFEVPEAALPKGSKVRLTARNDLGGQVVETVVE